MKIVSAHNHSLCTVNVGQDYLGRGRHSGNDITVKICGAKYREFTTTSSWEWVALLTKLDSPLGSDPKGQIHPSGAIKCALREDQASLVLSNFVHNVTILTTIEQLLRHRSSYMLRGEACNTGSKLLRYSFRVYFRDLTKSSLDRLPVVRCPDMSRDDVGPLSFPRLLGSYFGISSTRSGRAWADETVTIVLAGQVMMHGGDGTASLVFSGAMDFVADTVVSNSSHSVQHGLQLPPPFPIW